MARWFRDGELVGDETPWWRGDRNSTRQTIILTHECQTRLGLAPPGATSKIEPLDVAFNAEFKKSHFRNFTVYMCELNFSPHEHAQKQLRQIFS